MVLEVHGAERDKADKAITSLGPGVVKRATFPIGKNSFKLHWPRVNIHLE